MAQVLPALGPPGLERLATVSAALAPEEPVLALPADLARLVLGAVGRVPFLLGRVRGRGGRVRGREGGEGQGGAVE